MGWGDDAEPEQSEVTISVKICWERKKIEFERISFEKESYWEIVKQIASSVYG